MNRQRIRQPLGSLAALLLCALLLSPLPAAASVLPLADARAQALAFRAEIESAQTELALLCIECDKLTADLEALLEKQSEQTLRDTLAAAQKEAEKNAKKKRRQEVAAPPQIALRQEIAALSDAIEDAESRLYDAQLTVAAQCEQAYCDVLLAETQSACQNQNVAAALHALRLAREQIQIGALSETALAPLEARLLAVRAAGEKAILDAQAKRRILAAWTGEDLGPTVALVYPAAPPPLPENALEEALAFALPRDPAAQRAARKVLQIQTDLTAVLGDDPNVYRHYLKEISDYCITRQEDPPYYADFWKHFHQPALEAPDMWSGAYNLPWMAFRTPMPRSWLRPQALDPTVAADRPAALFALQIGAREAAHAAEAAQNARREKLAAAYEALRAAEKETQIAEKNCAAAQAAYAEQSAQQKRGNGDFSALRQCEFQLADYRETLAEHAVRRLVAHARFNLESRGYLHAPPRANPPVRKETAPAWYLKTSAAAPTFRFGVQLPQALAIETFRLFYGADPAGPETKAAQELRAPHLPYANREELRLELYREGALCYTAVLPAGRYSGKLELTAVEGAPLSACETVRQKKAALEAKVNALQKAYLDAVQQGQTDLQKQRKTELQRAIAELRAVEQQLAELEAKYTEKEG